MIGEDFSASESHLIRLAMRDVGLASCADFDICLGPPVVPFNPFFWGRLPLLK